MARSLRSRIIGMRTATRRRLMWIWILIVVLYFTWEAAGYRGIFSVVGEWQFDLLGQDLPTFTFALLVLAAAWPALMFARQRRRRRRRDPAADGRPLTPAEETAEARNDEREALALAGDFMHFMYGFAISFAVVGVLALLAMLLLPSPSGPLKPVALDAPRSVEFEEGPTRLTGPAAYGRTAIFSHGILVLERVARYAPVYPSGRTSDRVRLFVEMPRRSPLEEIEERETIPRTGLLVRADLPGALLRLFRDIGYPADTTHYVLYASAMTMRWPYIVIAIEFFVGALGFAIAGMIQRRHIMRLRLQLAGRQPPPQLLLASTAH